MNQFSYEPYFLIVNNRAIKPLSNHQYRFYFLNLDAGVRRHAAEALGQLTGEVVFFA